MPGLFINTVGFVSFLWTWTGFVCLRPLCRICSNGTAVLTNSHVSSGHYQRCNHETAAMGKAVESLSTNFHTFLQMFQHFKNGNTFKITQCFFSIFVNSMEGKNKPLSGKWVLDPWRAWKLKWKRGRKEMYVLKIFWTDFQGYIYSFGWISGETFDWNWTGLSGVWWSCSLLFAFWGLSTKGVSSLQPSSGKRLREHPAGSALQGVIRA